VPRLRLPLLLLSLSGVLTPLFAVSYVVPPDRFEIERSTAIITGRVLGSRVEKSERFGIETVTAVVVEESIKGEAGPVVEIHEPGGLFGNEARLIVGVPQFTDGDRVLLFLYQREGGDYAVNDLQLGSFRFAKNVADQELVVREESELSWEVNGTPHLERHRAAAAFLDYVRAVARGETAAAAEYFLATLPLAGTPAETAAKSRALHPGNNATFTATSYCMSHSGGLGVRWNVFPGNVNWNQGNFESGALGNGTAQINAGFSAWDGAGAHYVLTSSNANANGFLEAADGVNNIVFEKNLTSFGVQPFSCTSGGALGLGGTHALFGAGTHTFRGETFGTIIEGDVSLNQGIKNCTTGQLPPGEFNTLLTHELGHTLDIRHSDQNRTLNAACSTDPTLDCSGQAVMNHILVSGLNGHLQTWDVTAFSAVYINNQACIPPSISQQPSGSAINNGGTAQLTVTATGTPLLTYQWFAGASGDTSTPVGGGTSATVFVNPSVTTSYWVRVTGQCAPAADSATAKVTVNAGICPGVILGTPQAVAVNGGFQLSVSTAGGSSFLVRWFQGESSGAGPQIGIGNPLLVTPTQTTTYWSRVTNSCGNAADSAVVRVTVITPPSRRRIAVH
jgi:hypothetical protein